MFYYRGVQLSNPFYSIWASDTGAKVAVSFSLPSCKLWIVFSCLSVSLYIMCFVWSERETDQRHDSGDMPNS